MNILKFLSIGLIIVSHSLCVAQKQIKAPALKQQQAPFEISQGGSFYKDVPYDTYKRTVLDFFKPADSARSPFVMIIHGGGFIRGNKEKAYSSTYFQGLINNLLDNNVAVALINYRFVEKGDKQGILKSIMDSKRALQFLRYHNAEFNLNKSQTVLMGSSAGAGTALWIGLNDELADENNEDPIMRESTRVNGLVCTSTQATYDLLKWSSDVFGEYASEGLSDKSIARMIGEARIGLYLGISSAAQLNSPAVIAYREKLDMLALITPDDPEMYVSNKNIPYTVPVNTSELYHHPLHAKSLKDKADLIGAKGIFYVPQMNIDTREGESIEDFILRVIE